MQVIITGGTGLIGRALASSLTADNHEVIVLSRSPQKAKNVPAAAEVVQWDGRTAKEWGHWVDGADAIVNLAGESIGAGRWTAVRKQRIHDSRINAGKAVVEAIEAAENKPGVLIQSSAVGYYGPRNDTEVSEDTPPGHDFLAKLCVAWEASTAPVETMGVRRVIIRTGLVLSLDGGAFPRMLLPFKLFAGGPLGGGQQGFSWIHIADAVAGIRFLIDKPAASGPFNLTAPMPLTNAEFGRVLGRVLHRPAIMPTPSFALRLAFGEMSTVLLTGQQAVPYRLQDLGFTLKFPKAESALRDLLQ
jgi:uncharacterized protein (TIGR01777 family)